MKGLISTRDGYPSCSSIKTMSEKNKGYHTGSRDELIAKGYSPCGRCHP